jgi:hypothetical protein
MLDSSSLEDDRRSPCLRPVSRVRRPCKFEGVKSVSSREEAVC